MTFEVLIIEDDIHKLESLTKFIYRNLVNTTIKSATNLQDAIQLINLNLFNLILIDMAIPSHATISGGGSPMSLLNGGLEVILELSSLDREDDCIIITQFHEVEICSNNYTINQAKDKIWELLECKVLDCILYEEDNILWQTQLIKSICTYENFNS